MTMECPFCKREVQENSLECPYCHYQFPVDAEVMSSDERDSFNGLTIEEDGSTYTENNGANSNEANSRPYGQGEYDQENRDGAGFQMHTFGGTGCLIWLLILLFIVIFISIAFLKMIFAVPILGVLLAVYILNSMFRWF